MPNPRIEKTCLVSVPCTVGNACVGDNAPLKAFAQLSSDVTQTVDGLHEVVLNQIDLLENIGFTSPSSELTIQIAGKYLVIAAPQVGNISSGTYVARFWFRVNGVDVPNSNIELHGAMGHKDVIITQGILDLNVGDVLEVFMDGANAEIEAITNVNEPLVPSIIFTMYLL